MSTYTGKITSDIETFQMPARSEIQNCFEMKTFKRFKLECDGTNHICYITHTARVVKDKSYTVIGEDCIVDGNDAIIATSIEEV